MAQHIWSVHSALSEQVERTPRTSAPSSRKTTSSSTHLLCFSLMTNSQRE